MEYAALERLKLISNVVTTLVPSCLIGSSILQRMRTCMTARMSLNIGQIPPLITEFAVPERKKSMSPLFLGYY